MASPGGPTRRHAVKCPRCGRENPVGQKFCGDCGSRLALTCPDCGSTANPPGQKFCGECGQLLDGPRPPSSQVEANAPDRYTPRHLAEKILTSRSSLEGEGKQVTVLFADLKGSTELLADRDPEEARNRNGRCSQPFPHTLPARPAHGGHHDTHPPSLDPRCWSRDAAERHTELGPDRGLCRSRLQPDDERHIW